MSLKNSIKKLLYYFSSKIHKNLDCRCKNDDKKILIVSLTHLGDTVLLEPFIYELSKIMPNTRFDVLTKEGIEDIYSSFRYKPDNIFSLNAFWLTKKSGKFQSLKQVYYVVKKLGKKKYDKIIVTHPHLFTSIIVYLMNPKCSVGYREKNDRFLNDIVPDELFNTFVLQRNTNLINYICGRDINFKEPILITKPSKTIERLLQYDKDNYYIAIHPGAGGKQKIWDSSNFVSVIDIVFRDIPNCCFVLIGHGDDKEYIDNIIKKVRIKNIVNLYGKLDLLNLPKIFHYVDYMLTNDSGLMHIAYATKTPGVAIFGPSDYKIWAPRSKHWKVYYNNKNINKIKPMEVAEWIAYVYNNK